MKKIIKTNHAPNPIGPYSQAVLYGGTLYTSGQIAIEPKTNKLITENIEKETKQVMENLKAILKAAKMGFEHVVKTSIFISDMDDFVHINAIYITYFQGKFPARETIQVARLPKDVKVEISMIAQK